MCVYFGRRTFFKGIIMMEKILPLIERMYIFLEDGNWNKANEYCERILDLSPKNTDAYIGKLMIDYKINQISNFENCKKSFENNANYQRILQYGSDTIKLQFQNYLIKINSQKEQINQRRQAGIEKLKQSSSKIITFLIVFVIVLGCALYFLIPKNKNVDNVEINKEKNYITYQEMNIKLPYSEDYTVSVNNNKIVLSQGFNLTINEFLKYIYAPTGKSFSTSNSYASSNGDSSFIIEDYITVKTQYYANGDWTTETLDLIFCGYGKNYTAKYINKSGKVPLRFGNFATTENAWRRNIYFEHGDTIIKGQYTDGTKIEIKVYKE